MFAFFVNKEFKGFWQNKPEDDFIDATIKGMGWAPETVTVAHFTEKINPADEIEFDSNLRIREVRTLTPARVKEFEENERGEPDNSHPLKDHVEVPAVLEKGDWKTPSVFFAGGNHLRGVKKNESIFFRA